MIDFARDNPGDDGDGNAADDRLALLLARGATKRHAARECGINVRTVYRRLERPEFRARVEHFRNEMLSQAVGRLTSIARKAVGTLEALLEDPNSTVRLGAARTVLTGLIDVQEHAEMARRLEELERQLSPMKAGRF